MKQMIHPKKVIAWGLMAFLYVVLSVRLLFLQVPQMLREADTVVNLLALVAVAAWALITYYVVYLIRNRKPTRKKGIRR